ncbi:TCP-1/cpn60 chaperonin family protein [Tanacetum coccineum]
MDYKEQKIGAGIFKRALEYPARQIAKNGGVKGSVVIKKILSNDDVRYGYNDASNEYEDLMASDIIGPTKVVRCCIEHFLIRFNSSSGIVNRHQAFLLSPPLIPLNLYTFPYDDTMVNHLI